MVEVGGLTPEERELLKAATVTGDFLVITAEQIPSAIINAGGGNFPAVVSPESCAAFVAAFKSLCERGFAEPDDGDRFCLTAAGFQRAKDL